MSAEPRSWVDWWLVDRTTGRRGVAQIPSPPIWVFAVVTVLRWSPYDGLDDELDMIGSGALIVWGLDELVRGVNPFRRLLGALVLAWQLAGLVAKV